MKANVWKMDIVIIDHENISLEDIKTMLRERMRHISALVLSSKKKEIEWDDSLPINQRDGWEKAVNDMFMEGK